MASRGWTCRRCGVLWPRTKQKCTCGRPRPPRRQAKHLSALEIPYEVWVEWFGERCGICGREPKGRRLDRDHDHETGQPRGLLCHRCNRALPSFVTVEWLQRAIAYLALRRDP